ncbi:TIGR04219 family outer membrane beta-barrel protein [Marinobacter panjinensis]|uniref:TIGR04219 family outer membrane beta-barrel protein n=1 Tax=Marinobacter panjinensis TaxID=2576384 RepID=A0A4U6R379_9GAMM|nr:TIGR04219 family outer membrane beta-barrel protein [Marinobacter panjinensis]MCR8915736.1 TIGR04219 family outer membrane beta-barrel protein [Marinobacter panjinensis]TKV67282.1 TIGR04219 family outer membrane beta-barrel protein [Marinobacter panjinensis]
MRKLILALGGSLIIAAPVVSADVIGVGANISYWDSDLSGKAGKNNDAVDVENDLDLESDTNANLSAYFEHPVPVLPNVRLNYTGIEQSGRGELSTQFDVVPGGVEVDSDLDLTQFDVTLYYEVLDNWVNLDLGLTARSLDGELTVQEIGGIGSVSQTEVDGVIPMGYLAARFDLPFSGVSVGGEANLISFDGDSIYDYNAYGQYELSLLQLRAGYRQISIDFEDSDDRLDIELGGPFVSAGLTF